MRHSLNEGQQILTTLLKKWVRKSQEFYKEV